jgi:hypothetical protein
MFCDADTDADVTSRYNNSDCAGMDLGQPVMVTTLHRCEEYCRAIGGCHGFVLGGVPSEIARRCGAVPGATPRQYCCLPKSACTDIQHKDNDTAILLSSSPAPLPGVGSSLELRFNNTWWNVTASRQLDVTLQAPRANEVAVGVNSLPLMGRRVSGARGSETVFCVDISALRPWGMLIVRTNGTRHRRPHVIKTDDGPATVSSTVMVDISSASSITSPFPHFWEKVFGSGHGALTLRSDWQRAATEATKELGVKAVRFHGLFDEDMRILSRNATGGLVYNWSSIDASFDFQLRSGMTPKIELSFFPAIIANCTAFMSTMGEHGTVINPGYQKCRQGFFYGGIMSVPFDYDASGWVDFVSAFAHHVTTRYGAQEIEKWRFEVGYIACRSDLKHTQPG